MKKIKLILGVLVIFVILMTACSAPGTSDRTVVTQPAATPDIISPYLSAYFKYLNEWSRGLHGVQDVNQKLADGSGTLADDELKLQLANALADLEEASNGMSGLTPPIPQFQYFKDKGRELDDQTKIFTSMYVQSLTGDDASKDSAMSAFDNATNIYSEIVTEFNKTTDLLIPE